MSKKQNQKDEEFLRSVKEQLYIETFEKDVPDYSHEKVETLVKMLELGEEGDETEPEEAQKAFEERFRKATEEKKKNRGPIRRKRIAQTVAAMLAIVMLADITSEAVMDESIFHMLTRWTNQMTIRPGESSEPETADFQEDETQIFTTVEEFAEDFGDDFLVCTWLPEGVELKEILLTKSEGIYNYMWNYGSQNIDNVVSIRMYQKIDKDIAGLTGTEIEDGKMVNFSNGINAKICNVNENERLAAFEYNGWWYMVYFGIDKDIVESVIGGMERYE